MPNPSPTPQTRLDACIQNLSRVSTVYGGGGGGGGYECCITVRRSLSRAVVVQQFRVAYREIYPRSNLIFLSVHSFIYETFKSIVGYSRYTKSRSNLLCDHTSHATT